MKPSSKAKTGQLGKTGKTAKTKRKSTLLPERWLQYRKRMPDLMPLINFASEEKEQAWLRLLGLAYRAGALVIGEAAVKDKVRHGHAFLIFVAKDASPALFQAHNTRELRRDVPGFLISEQAKLGSALGRERISVVALLSRDFVKGFFERLEQDTDFHFSMEDPVTQTREREGRPEEKAPKQSRPPKDRRKENQSKASSKRQKSSDRLKRLERL